MVQVALLWERDRAKLASYSIKVQLSLLNHKIAFLNNLWGHKGNIITLSGSFNANKLCSKVLSR